jgi:hypothetical protein
MEVAVTNRTALASSAVLLALLAVLACSRVSADADGPAVQLAEARQADGAEAEVSCATDGDCASGFCDRARCAAKFDPRHYGWECDESSLPADNPIRASKLRVCGAYVCREGRCRSCLSNADCSGGGVCQRSHDPATPGWFCGAP